MKLIRIALFILTFVAVAGAGEVVDSPADLALRKLQLAPGVKSDLFAAEPDVTNPVGIHVDDRGRVFLAETRRYNTAALYVKQHSHWYFEDLACRVVDDRIAMAKKFMGDGFSRLTAQSEVVRLLEDRAGNGRADSSTVFADGFNTAADGVACNVIVRGNDVWLANVPRLWRLTDTNNDGKADERKALQDGYGVRFGNSGHDLHGLVFGPDGKLYFSMGDRGMNVVDAGRTFAYPDTGTVLRCNPDGSEFEVVASGLRNPQGLAFDDLGNLFTADNNADMGDECRWLHILDGGEYGWRTGFQYATHPWEHQPIKVNQPLTIARKSLWMTEELWRGKAAYILPPSGFVSRGPCGLTSYPGTGLSARYDNHFFLCDFPGGVHSFGIQPSGATYELTDVHKFIWDLWPTDAKFGPDGKLYVCDWVYGFPMTGKGRVFRAYDPATVQDAAAREVQQLLKDGMEKRTSAELSKLLAHRDRRIRQNAQWELVNRKDETVLESAARGGSTLLARLHGLWGLGQLKRVAALVPLLRDADPEIRTQACRTLGDLRAGDAYDGLVTLLSDPSARVKLHAALALGRLGRKEATAPLLAMLRANVSDDSFQRHAAVMGLSGANDSDGLLKAANDPSPLVRMGVLLALRRMKRDEVQMFLTDKDPALVVEAARAINDVPLLGGTVALAQLLEAPTIPEGAVLRAINGNFRLGSSREATRLAVFAQRPEAPAALRAEALGALGGWGNPSGRDRVTGLWRPLPPREKKPALDVLEPIVAKLFEDSAEDVQIAALRAAVSLSIQSCAPSVERLAKDTARAASVRVEALRTSAALHTPEFESIVGLAVNDANAEVRKEGIELFPRLQRPEAAEILGKLAQGDAPDEIRQAAIAALGRIPGEKSDAILGALFDAMLEGKLKPTLALDVQDAAANRATLKERLAKLDAGLPQDDPVAPYRVATQGGDAVRGKRVFLENAGVACMRCHRVGKEGGEVGPMLNTVGAQRTPQDILESIVAPNRVIVAGYGQEMVATKSDGVQVGRVKSEDESGLVLTCSDGQEKKIAKTDIRKRRPALSAMPEDLAKMLSKRELRDLVAYLSSLK